MSLKYYIYISDSKVDMLYAQIPKSIKNGLAAELKLNIGMLSASLKQGPLDETKYSKLQIVNRYIEKELELGSIDEPKEYIRGIAPVRWGSYGSSKSVVYFGGSTGNTVFGFGGSLQHLIGVSCESHVNSGSITPYLLSVLADESSRSSSRQLASTPFSQEEMVSSVMRAVYVANSRMKGPEQMVEFLAKRLFFLSDHPSEEDEWWRESKKNVLLATPVYVAMAE